MVMHCFKTGVVILLVLCCSAQFSAGFVDVGSLLESVKDKGCKIYDFNGCKTEEKTTSTSGELGVIEVGSTDGVLEIPASGPGMTTDCDKKAFESEIDDLEKKFYSALNELTVLRTENAKLIEEKNILESGTDKTTSVSSSQNSLSAEAIEKLKELERNFENIKNELASCNSEKENVKGEKDQQLNNSKSCEVKFKLLNNSYEKCGSTLVNLEEKLTDTEKGLNMAAEKTEDCERRSKISTLNCEAQIKKVKDDQEKELSETLRNQTENCETDKFSLKLEIEKLRALAFSASTIHQLENELAVCTRSKECWETQYTSYLARPSEEKRTPHDHHNHERHSHRHRRHGHHHRQQCPQLHQC